MFLTYVVCYHLAKFELEISLANGEILRQFVLRGKLNQIVCLGCQLNQEVL
jgi:hypothetical protein